jgi:hypothetical protein
VVSQLHIVVPTHITKLHIRKQTALPIELSHLLVFPPLPILTIPSGCFVHLSENTVHLPNEDHDGMEETESMYYVEKCDGYPNGRPRGARKTDTNLKTWSRSSTVKRKSTTSSTRRGPPYKSSSTTLRSRRRRTAAQFGTAFSSSLSIPYSSWPTSIITVITLTVYYTSAISISPQPPDNRLINASPPQ